MQAAHFMARWTTAIILPLCSLNDEWKENDHIELSLFIMYWTFDIRLRKPFFLIWAEIDIFLMTLHIKKRTLYSRGPLKIQFCTLFIIKIQVKKRQEQFSEFYMTLPISVFTRFLPWHWCCHIPWISFKTTNLTDFNKISFNNKSHSRVSLCRSLESLEI